MSADTLSALPRLWTADYLCQQETERVELRKSLFLYSELLRDAALILDLHRMAFEKWHFCIFWTELSTTQNTKRTEKQYSINI